MGRSRGASSFWGQVETTSTKRGERILQLLREKDEVSILPSDDLST
jgi:hypothetical protein